MLFCRFYAKNGLLGWLDVFVELCLFTKGLFAFVRIIWITYNAACIMQIFAYA